MSRRSGKGQLPAIAGGVPVRPGPLSFYRADIDESDVEAVANTLRSGWLTVGPRTEMLEKEIATYVGADHVIAVSSCSEGMFLCLRALGIGPGDEVITSALTFASTVNAIIHVGATPVLADIETETFGLDPEHVGELINDRTRAIMPVHFGGQGCRIEEICELARDRAIAVVEDAAHSFGAEVNGRKLGTWGDATVFSFYATKNLTTGEGGAITTNNPELANKLRLLSYHGMSRDSWTRYADEGSWYYQVEIPGFKSNMNDVQAALGLSQLSRIDALLEGRRRVAASLLDKLGDAPYLTLPAERPGNRHTWHLFVVRLNLDGLTADRNQFSKALSAENIGHSVHFIPIHHHPFFAPYRADGLALPRCDDYYSRCISLPLYPGMSEADVKDVAAAVTRIAEYYSAD